MSMDKITKQISSGSQIVTFDDAASSSSSGIVTTGEQTFGGIKTFGTIRTSSLELIPENNETQTINGTAAYAEQLENPLTLKIIGTSGGSNLERNYIYNGSTSKSITLQGSENISLGIVQGSGNTNDVVTVTYTGATTTLASNSGLTLTNGAIAHASTITAGSVGSTTEIPIITYNSTGHITGVSTANISSLHATTASITESNNVSTLTIGMSDNNTTFSTTIPVATTSQSGFITTTTQSIAGNKTFTGNIIQTDGTATVTSSIDQNHDYSINYSATSGSGLNLYVKNNTPMSIAPTTTATNPIVETYSISNASVGTSLLSLGISYFEETSTQATSNIVISDVPKFRRYYKGLMIALKFKYNNISGATLNINNIGAIPIFYNGGAVIAGTFKQNTVALLVYENTTNIGGCWNAIYSYAPQEQENNYITGLSWSNGTTSGPTATITRENLTSLSVSAIPSASGTQSGVITTSAQTISGMKTFSNGITGSLTGIASGNLALTGGTLTGNVTFNTSSPEIKKVDTTGSLTISGGTDNAIATINGSALVLNGKDSNTGNFVLYATSGVGEYKSLTGSSSGDLTWTGNIVASGGSITGTTVTASSDIRLKHNLKEVGDVDLSSLKAYSYNFREMDRRNIGLIAQDVQKILPESVVPNQDGYYSLDYNSIVAILVDKINKLENELKNLKA